MSIIIKFMSLKMLLLVFAPADSIHVRPNESIGRRQRRCRREHHQHHRLIVSQSLCRCHLPPTDLHSFVLVDLQCARFHLIEFPRRSAASSHGFLDLSRRIAPILLRTRSTVSAQFHVRHNPFGHAPSMHLHLPGPIPCSIPNSMPATNTIHATLQPVHTSIRPPRRRFFLIFIRRTGRVSARHAASPVYPMVKMTTTSANGSIPTRIAYVIAHLPTCKTLVSFMLASHRSVLNERKERTNEREKEKERKKENDGNETPVVLLK